MERVRKRPSRQVETTDFLRMISRMLAAAGRRVAESDVAEFQQMLQLEQAVLTVLEDAVRGLRASGMTWQEIGDAAGTTRQAAHQRWAKKLEPAE